MYVVRRAAAERTTGVVGEEIDYRRVCDLWNEYYWDLGKKNRYLKNLCQD